MFNQFYERAASKDKLRGLTDEEIKRQISSSPKKIKVQSRELIKYLKEKGEVSFSDKGDIRLSNSMNKNLR